MEASRRKSIKKIGYTVIGAPAILSAGSLLHSCSKPSSADKSESEIDASSMFFSISLAQWSLHRAFFDGTLKAIDFPSIARKEYGIDAVEYVNAFFFDKARDTEFLTELKNQCDSEGVRSLLIMCDREGNLGDLDDAARNTAVENHYKWVDAAKFLGCHSIRVNAAGEGTAEEVKSAAIEGLGKLTEYGAQNEINVIVENHGGYSSDGSWLSDVIRSVNSPFCGTLPDFGNFCIERGEDGCINEYDRYLGMEQLMPFAKGVSAKSHEFDESGNEIYSDYSKILKIVRDAGFRGYIGIEYEGSKLSENEGIKATKALLERVGPGISGS